MAMTEEELTRLAASLGLLRPGTPDGPALRAWRRILARHAEAMGYTGAALPEQGDFSPAIERWTRQFQNDAYLARVDGVVGPITWGAALRRYPDEAAALATPAATTKRAAAAKPSTAAWPAETRAALPPEAWSARFGPPGDETRLVRVAIPELVGIPGAPDDGLVLFHRDAVPQVRALFAAWRAEGLLRWVLRFDGAFQNRRMRPASGSAPRPEAERPWSAHAHGIAFDINADWNLVGHPPAGPQERGTVLPLVETAQRCGFRWCGFDRARPDGSQFELGGAEIGKAEAQPVTPRRTGLFGAMGPATRKMAGPVRATGVRPTAAKKAAAPKKAAPRKAAPKKVAPKKVAPKKVAAAKAAPKKAVPKRAPASRKAAAPKAPARKAAAPKAKGRG
jgi:hypothetical protein